MKLFPRLCLWGLAFPWVIGTAAGEQPAGGRFTVPFEATTGFRAILLDRGLKPQKDLREAAALPKTTVLIILGKEAGKTISEIPGGLTQFTHDGGAVLVATDQRTVVADFDLTVNGTFLETADARLCFQQNPQCPMVTDFSGTDSPPFEGLRLATNKPSYIDAPQVDLQSQDYPFFARFSPVHAEGDGVSIRPVFGVASDRPGRFMLLADHSIFINGMLLQPKKECDNFQFADRCIAWLKGSKDRDKVVLIENGQIVTDFGYTLSWIPAPPLPPPPINPADLPRPPVQVLDELLAGWEKDNAFDQLITTHVPLGPLLCGLSVALTACLVLFGLYRLIQSRYRVEVEAQLLGSRVAPLVAARAAVHQRHQAMLEGNNLWEEARALSRQWFAEAGFRWEASPSAAPRLTIDAGWMQRRTLEHQVLHLWRFATGDIPVRVSSGEFTRLVAEVDHLKAAAAEGKLRIVQPENPQE